MGKKFYVECYQFYLFEFFEKFYNEKRETHFLTFFGQIKYVSF